MNHAPNRPMRPTQAQNQLGQTIGDVSRAWRYEMNQRLKPFGLSLSTRQVLVQLYRNPGGLMQNELARKLGVEGPTLVRLLDLLEKKEWIRRMIAPSDKRRKLVELTEKANEQIAIIERLSESVRLMMMKGIPDDEVLAGLSVMQRIRDNLLA